MALGVSIGRLWSLARQAEDLFSLQAKVASSLQAVEERLRAIEDRMLRLESDQAQIITEARSAATMAASTIASGVVSDVVTRITRLEGRADQLEQRRPRRLPGPAD